MNTYTKMCDCFEVQSQWKPKLGEYYRWWDRRYKEIGQAIWTAKDMDNFIAFREEFIWLPTQGQIQEIIKSLSFYGLMSIFCKWLDSQAGYSFGFKRALLGENPAREQLWLAFYMREEHQKVWDGKKWIKGKGIHKE